jgi:hypothetical protein
MMLALLASALAGPVQASQPLPPADASPPPVAPLRSVFAEPETDCRRASTERDRDCLGWAVPDFAYVGSGGYLGLAVVGVGYAMLDDRLNVAVAYGMTPSFYSGRDVHTLAGDISARPLHVALPWKLALVPYLGAGLLLTFGEHYFWRQPARYDRFAEHYYDSTARYWTAHVGLELAYRSPVRSAIERHGLFIEIRALDTLFLQWLANTHVIQPWEAASTALGYRIAF